MKYRQIKRLLKSSLDSILRNRMRSLLTSLGIIIGVAAVIVMSAIGQGSQELIEKEINDLGTNLIIVFPGSSHSGGVSRGAGSVNRFTYEDVEKIKEKTRFVRNITPIVQSGGQVVAGSNNWSTQIIGVSNEYFLIRSWDLKFGHYFSEKEEKSGRKVAILGATVATKLFPDLDPTGKTIRIREIPFVVIGVLKEKGQTSMGTDQDDIIIAPWSTVLYRMKGGRYVDLINASATTTENITQAESELKSIIRDAHRLNAGEADDFTVQNQTEITQMVTRTSRILTWLLGSIAAISLLVGGIGIMNIMLVTVTERTREIGIRLSVGARPKDILAQFLIEAVALSLVGGIIGILLALLVSLGLNQFTSYYTLIKSNIVVVSFFFSGAVGIFFGFYPAQKAARLNPIDSLRYE